MLVHTGAPRIVSPAAVGDEILEHLPAIARKRRLDLGVLLLALAALPVEWIGSDSYSPHENAARRLIKERGEDFEVSRLPILTTGQLLDHLEGRGAR